MGEKNNAKNGIQSKKTVSTSISKSNNENDNNIDVIRENDKEASWVFKVLIPSLFTITYLIIGLVLFFIASWVYGDKIINDRSYEVHCASGDSIIINDMQKSETMDYIWYESNNLKTENEEVLKW